MFRNVSLPLTTNVRFYPKIQFFLFFTDFLPTTQIFPRLLLKNEIFSSHTVKVELSIKISPCTPFTSRELNQRTRKMCTRKKIVVRSRQLSSEKCLKIFSGASRSSPNAVHPQVYAAEDDRSERELSQHELWEVRKNSFSKKLVPLRKANMKVKVLVCWRTWMWFSISCRTSSRASATCSSSRRSYSSIMFCNSWSALPSASKACSALGCALCDWITSIGLISEWRIRKLVLGLIGRMGEKPCRS